MKSIRLIAYAILIINLVSCTKEFNSHNPKETVQQQTDQQIMSIEDHLFPGQTGEEVNLEIDGIEVTLKRFGNQYVLDNDIVLSEKEVESIRAENLNKGAGVKSSSRKWPNSVAYYRLDENNLSSGQISRTKLAIEEISNRTNFTFIERTNEPAYIEITSKSFNYSSSIGKSSSGGKQDVFITTNAPVGLIQHELLHAIGIHHEHKRLDRDSYVNIYWDNILSGKESNFEKYSSLNGKDYGNFDFNSVMKYSSMSFSKNGLPTMTKKNGSLISGNYTGLSSGDIKTVNTMYPPSHFFIELKQNGNRLRPVWAGENSKMKQQPKSSGSGPWVQWKKVLTGDGYFHLVNKATNKLFRPKNNNSSTSTQQKPLGWSGSWTRWKFKLMGDGYMKIINKQTGGALYANHSNPSVNSKISCGQNNSANLRHWRIKPVN